HEEQSRLDMSDRQDSAAQAIARQAEMAPGRLTYGRISMVVPSGVTRQSSSISSSVSAMQPTVQSFQRCHAPIQPSPFRIPWIMISKPAETPRSAARVLSLSDG